MVAADLLEPLEPVVVGAVTFLVDRTRPVAALRGVDGSVHVVCWPNAPLPAKAASPQLYPGQGCVWVVYGALFADQPLSHTAVRIGADAQILARELGTLEVIGADDQGLWVTPRSFPHVEALDEVPTGEGAVVDEDREAARGAAVESWAEFERAQRAADEAAARAFAATIEVPEGVEGSFGWFSYPDAHQEQRALPPLPAPAPPAPTGPVTLRRLRADGGRNEMVASHLVEQVAVTGAGVLRMVFHPTGPVVTNDPDGRGRSYRYPRRVAEIDVSTGLPTAVDLDAADSQPIEDDPQDWTDQETADPGEPVDLSGVAATRWTLRPQNEEQVAAAVRAVREQFAGLDEPTLRFARRDQRWHWVQGEFADVDLHVEGVWPATEVVVDFSHRPTPGHRFRARHRVFDDAGLPIGHPHLRAELDETLATTDPRTMALREGRREV